MTARQLMDTVTLPSAPVAASPLTVTLVKSRDELEAVTPHWLALLERGAIGQNVHNDPRMIAATVRHRPEAQLNIILIWQGDRIVCVAPFYCQAGHFSFDLSVWKLGKFPAHILRIFGERLVFADDAQQHECLGRVIDALGSIRRDFDYLWLYGLTHDDPLWTVGIEQNMLSEKHSLVSIVLRQETNHQIELPNSVDEYVASLSPSTRQNLRRSTRRFFEDPRARIAKMSQPSQVAQLLAWIEHVDANSWQGRTFDGPDRNSEFNRQFLQDVAACGWLQSYVLLHDDQPVAFEHGYYYGGVYFGLECAYDQSWSSAGPGSVLIFSVIQDLIAECSAKAFDFGCGDMPYKRSFGNVGLEASTVYCIPPNRWRYIIRLQMFVDRLYSRVRNGLIRFKIDKFVRKWIKRQR